MDIDKNTQQDKVLKLFLNIFISKKSFAAKSFSLF